MSKDNDAKEIPATSSNEEEIKKILETNKAALQKLNAIKVHPVTDTNTVLDYAKNKQGKETLNDYVKRTIYPDENIIVMCKLENLTFQRKQDETPDDKKQLVTKDGYLLIPLKDADFTGCIINNVNFQECDLKRAIFRDVDLNHVNFADSRITDIDFRGADLQTVTFSKNYEDTKSKLAHWSEGIKYSTSVDLIRVQANIQGVKAELTQEEKDKLKQDKQEAINTQKKAINVKKQAIKAKEKEIEESSKPLQEAPQSAGWSWGGVYGAAVNLLTGYKPEPPELMHLKDNLDQMQIELKEMQGSLQKIQKDLKEMEEGKFPAPPPPKIDPSLNNVFRSEKSVFDPGYIRGSTPNDSQTVKYIELDRKDLENYIAQLGTDSPVRNLNEFAKNKEKDAGQAIDPNTKYLANCSSKTNHINNTWQRKDFSSLNFSGADLSGAIFTGSNLRGCTFDNTNLSRANFDATLMNKATFKNNTDASDTSFLMADISETTIENSIFRRACMPHSIGEKAQIDKANFDDSSIKNGKWNGVIIDNSSFNFANLESISLANADLRRVEAKQVILDKAILDGSKVIESDLTNAYLQEASLINSKWEKTRLDHIKAKVSKWEGADLDQFTSLQGADLEQAILTKIKAEGVNFTGANLSQVKAEYAILKGAKLTEATARFADFKNAMLNEVTANNTDLTGADLEKVQAANADFQGANFQGAKAIKANFKNTNLTDADLRGTDFFQAILKEANVHNAKVDAATNLAKADIEDIKGKFIDEKGKDVAPEEQKKFSETVEKVKNSNVFKNYGGKLLGSVGGGLQSTGGFIKQPLSLKLGLMLGGGVGLVGGLLVAGTVIGVVTVATGGVGLIPLLAAGGAAIAVVGGCAAVGAAAGGLLAKKGGLGCLLAAGAGTLALGPLGAIAAGGSYLFLNKKYGIDKKLGDAIEKGGERCKKAAEQYIITPQDQENYNKYQEAAKLIPKVENEPKIKLEKGGEAAAKNLQHAKFTQQEVKKAEVKTQAQQVAKEAGVNVSHLDPPKPLSPKSVGSLPLEKSAAIGGEEKKLSPKPLKKKVGFAPGKG